MQHTTADLCVYIKSFPPTNTEGCEPGRLIATLHVNDFLIARRPKQLEWFRKALLDKFGIKWSTDLLFLGIGITRSPDRSLALSQKHYLEQVLADLNMLDCRPRKTPILKRSIQELIDH